MLETYPGLFFLWPVIGRVLCYLFYQGFCVIIFLSSLAIEYWLVSITCKMAYLIIKLIVLEEKKIDF